MEKIQECAINFQKLIDTTSYVFHLAKRKVTVVTLDFAEKDFLHASGLHYLTDLSIPKNKKNTINWILNKDNPITDEFLEQSEFYKGRDGDEKDVERRISELRFLEDYLDENNIIRIYSPKDGPKNNSIIKCDYIIESQLKGSHTIVYIFIKHRAGEDSPCCIVSFGVKKNISYGGINIYWMLKDKIVNGIRATIFQNPKYTNEQKLKNESQNQEG